MQKCYEAGQSPLGYAGLVDRAEDAPQSILEELRNRLTTTMQIQLQALDMQNAHWARVMGPEPTIAGGSQGAEPKPVGLAQEIGTLVERLIMQASDLRSNAERVNNRI